MKKNDLDHFKLKLKYLKWERDCMFHNDSVECSGYFDEDDAKLVDTFKEQLINILEREIKKVEKSIDILEKV